MTNVKVIMQLILMNTITMFIYYPIVSLFLNIQLSTYTLYHSFAFLFTSIIYYKFYGEAIRYIIPKVQNVSDNMIHYIVSSVLGILISGVSILFLYSISASAGVALMAFTVSLMALLFTLNYMESYKLIN